MESHHPWYYNILREPQEDRVHIPEKKKTPQDKAVRKFMVRAIVDASSARDLKEQFVIEKYFFFMEFFFSLAL